MKKRLALLDADVVIGLHEINKWKTILSNYSIYISSVVFDEAMHYSDPSGKRMAINLSERISKGDIKLIEGTAQEIAKVKLELKKKRLDGVHSGELESITIIFLRKVKDLCICLIDGLAIKAASFLDLREKMFSFEELVARSGGWKKKDKIPYQFSKKRFKKYSLEGAYLREEVKKTKNL